MTKTTMPNPYLPQETLDHIVDFLHDEPEALKACCLASKQWVPRARKHLFAMVEFSSAKDLELWKQIFSDPSISPAYHTHTMIVHCTQLVMTENAWAGGLIQTFSRVARLRLVWASMEDNFQTTPDDLEKISLAPFHLFSSTLKSLRMEFLILPHPQIFDLVHSSPLLEDFALFGISPSLNDGGDFRGQQAVIPLISPALTGCLELYIYSGIGNPTRRLLDLPGGLHFRTLALSWSQEDDHRWIAELVARCSHTLESLDINYIFRCTCSHVQSAPITQTQFHSSWARASLNQSLQSDKTPRCGFSTGIAIRRMDRDGTSNHHAQTSKSSANLHLSTFPLDLLQYWCRHWAILWRNGL